MTMIILPSKPTGETITVVFPFLDILAFGESITGATVAATVFSGTDASPSDILVGLATSSAMQVIQMVGAGIAGVIYQLTCTITTSNSNILVKSANLAVITAGGKFGS